MELRTAQTIRRFALGIAILAPSMAFAQRTFTYEPANNQTQVAETPKVLTFQASTVITIVGDAAQVARVSGPTKSFSLNLRPPAGSVGFINALLGDQMVSIKFVRSTIDGDMEAIVALPLTAKEGSEIKIDWQGADHTMYQTTVIAH